MKKYRSNRPKRRSFSGRMLSYFEAGKDFARMAVFRKGLFGKFRVNIKFGIGKRNRLVPEKKTGNYAAPGGKSPFNSDGSIRESKISKIKREISHSLRRKKQTNNAVAGSALGGWRRRVVQGCLLVVVLVVSGFLGQNFAVKYAADLDYFQLQHIDISGCRMVSGKEVKNMANLNFQRSFIGLDVEKIRTTIEKHPWVNRVTICKEWPSTLKVVVKEEKPLAMINIGRSGEEKLFYINDKGIPFAVVAGGQDLDFPVITGVEQLLAGSEKSSLVTDAIAFIKLTKKNSPDLPAQSVSEINLGDSGLTLYLVEYPFPVYLGQGAMKQKYFRLKRVLGVLYREHRKGSIISSVAFIRMNYTEDKVLVAQVDDI